MAAPTLARSGRTKHHRTASKGDVTALDPENGEHVGFSAHAKLQSCMVPDWIFGRGSMELFLSTGALPPPRLMINIRAS
ncbi:hypothetical protein B0A55_10334 [Friedmanniomyces simplex]|uniref:Uncharacterized protein n=1 Tax=Friedmanniomyces simplex TaxID=329884 RepID=A0A4U0X9V6_9PEZI|nr:hypothetical protein B0A55_10334 [Friedmanniomyces simplex]